MTHTPGPRAQNHVAVGGSTEPYIFGDNATGWVLRYSIGSGMGQQHLDHALDAETERAAQFEATQALRDWL